MSIFQTLSEQEAMRTDGSMRRAAKLRQDLNDHERATTRLFERIKTQTDEAAEQRMVVEFPLSPEMAAAYAVWCHANSSAEALTMTFPGLNIGEPGFIRGSEQDIGEAPIGPEHP